MQQWVYPKRRTWNRCAQNTTDGPIVRSDRSTSLYEGNKSRGWKIAAILVRMQSGPPLAIICVDTGCSLSLVDRQFLRRLCPKAVMHPVPGKPLIRRGIGSSRHVCSEYVVTELRIPGTLPSGEKATAGLKCELHVVDDLPPGILLGVDVLGSQAAMLDFSTKRLTLPACRDIQIPIGFTARGSTWVDGTQGGKDVPPTDVTKPSIPYKMPQAGSSGRKGKEDAGNTFISCAEPDTAADEDEAIQSLIHDEENESLRAGSNGRERKEGAGNVSISCADPAFAADEDKTYDEEDESLRTPHRHTNVEKASDYFYEAVDAMPTPEELPVDHNRCKDCISSGLDPKNNKSECLGCRKILFDGFLKEIATEQQRKGNTDAKHHALEVVQSKPKTRLFASGRVTEFLEARECLWNPRAIDHPQNICNKTDSARLTPQTSTNQYVSNKTDLARLTPQTSSAVYKEIYLFARTHKWCALSEDRWTRLFERITTHVLASQAGTQSAPKRVQHAWLVEKEQAVMVRTS